MAESLFFDVLPAEQMAVFRRLAAGDLCSNFYLAGGTALALQIGHRRSVDFDFFSPAPLDTVKMVRRLDLVGAFELFHQDKDTVNGALDGVRLSFFHYRYPPVRPCFTYESIAIANKLDIAAMKLEAIAGRGGKKDFVDLFFLLKEFAFGDIFAAYAEKFGTKIANRYHVFKSLVYFADAEEEMMPEMLKKVSWPEIKKTIAAAVKKNAIL